MLMQLSVNNIAVVKHTDIEFFDGLNVITGETGAGKSVITYAIGLILGEKATKNIIRTGEDKADVTALFYPDDSAWKKLNEIGISRTEDDTLLIFREVSVSGRSVCRINGVMCQLSLLKEAAEVLVNIHGQQDTQILYSEAKQLELIDGRAGLKEKLKEYGELYDKLKATEKRIEELKENEEKWNYEKELLEFQINEIEMLGVGENEVEELEERISELKNSENITKTLKEISKLISTGDFNAGDMLREASSQMQYLKGISGKFEELSQQLDDVTYRLEDVASEVSAKLYETESSPAELESLSDRLYAIKSMCNKYKCRPEELATFPEKAREKLDKLILSGKELETLISEKEKLNTTLESKAEEISKLRKEAAELFEKELMTELLDLNMSKTKFEVEFKSTENLTRSGKDKVEFLISPNAGESLKPMAKVASGGEMSRIMLGVKSFITAFESGKTYIFDEIDTGISGITAQRVAEKLKKISTKDQTFVITHSAHIAAKADNHYLIRKNMTDVETKTEVILLDKNGRIEEIARINAGENPSKTAIMQAKEMLDI